MLLTWNNDGISLIGLNSNYTNIIIIAPVNTSDVVNGVVVTVSNGKFVVTGIALKEGELARNIQPKQGSTPYVRFGNVPVVSLMLV